LVNSLQKQSNHIVRAGVADIQPNDLRRRATHHTQLDKIFVFGQEHAPLTGCDIPQLDIRNATETERTRVERIRKATRDRAVDSLRQVLVNEEPDRHYAAGMACSRRSRSAANAKHASTSS